MINYKDLKVPDLPSLTLRGLQESYCNNSNCNGDIECEDCIFDFGNLNKFKEFISELLNKTNNNER